MALRATTGNLQTQQHIYVPGDAEQLLRLLVEHVPSASERLMRHTAETDEEVLYELEIDGIHYTLLRRQPHNSVEHVSLSPRELAIAQLVAKGLPNKCIGDILEISPWTVATHIRRVFMKLCVTSRAAMVARLVEENLL